MIDRPILSVHKRIFIAAIPLIIFATAWFGYSAIINYDAQICFFRFATDKPCVFCGLTHAFAYASHLQLQQAYEHHPYWWAPALLIVITCFVYATGFGQKGFTLFWKRHWWIFVAALIVLSLARAYL